MRVHSWLEDSATWGLSSMIKIESACLRMMMNYVFKRSGPCHNSSARLQHSPVHCVGRFSISEPLIKSLSIVYANERVGDYPPSIVWLCTIGSRWDRTNKYWAHPVRIIDGSRGWAGGRGGTVSPRVVWWWATRTNWVVWIGKGAAVKSMKSKMFSATHITVLPLLLPGMHKHMGEWRSILARVEFSKQ